MLDELKEESIVNRVGGRFRLSTLIRKRLVALNTGAPPLVDLRTNDKMAIVIQEILQNKIYLDTSGNLQSRAVPQEEPPPLTTYAAVPVPLARDMQPSLPPEEDLSDFEDDDDEDE